MGVARAQAQISQPTAISRYRVVHGWPVVPEGRVLGSVAGCAVDSHDDVFVFHRNDRTWPDSDELSTTPIALPTVTLFDGRSGEVLAEWGENQFAMPHGLSVDANDNVWVTDVALQQVFKFSHDGKLLLTVGERGVAGNDATHFNRPTKVAVAADGSFFVSDGYRNTRVVKFSPQGKFLFQWGTPGTGPSQFNLPHCIAMDSAERIDVCDRTNGRVQIFDPTGKYLTEWKGEAIGRPYDATVARNGSVFMASNGPMHHSWVVVLRQDGTVLEKVGRWGNYDGQFEEAHCVAVAKDGSLYVGDIIGGRIQKFVPER